MPTEPVDLLDLVLARTTGPHLAVGVVEDERGDRRDGTSGEGWRQRSLALAVEVDRSRRQARHAVGDAAGDHFGDRMRVPVRGSAAHRELELGLEHLRLGLGLDSLAGALHAIVTDDGSVLARGKFLDRH